ncbi:MAG: hypothetical protein AAB527_02690 [Patescibacteria group bacterium]
MPYIKPEYRERLEGEIDNLALAIVDVVGKDDDESAYAGVLNYTITRLSLRVAIILFERMRYKVIAMLTGVFKNVSDEFYRRIAAPYEDKQAKKNGDIPEYDELLDEMNK